MIRTVAVIILHVFTYLLSPFVFVQSLCFAGHFLSCGLPQIPIPHPWGEPRQPCPRWPCTNHINQGPHPADCWHVVLVTSLLSEFPAPTREGSWLRLDRPVLQLGASALELAHLSSSPADIYSLCDLDQVKNGDSNTTYLIGFLWTSETNVKYMGHSKC